MPNNFFQFKQFRVEQGDCGMKVTTEACLFAALLRPSLQKKIFKALDIGTGTGLLSLMMAQRFPMLQFHAVEIDQQAYYQAKYNVEKSPWLDRIRVTQSSIQQFARHTDQQYDLIISNPPFFTNHVTGCDVQKNVALHTDLLSLEDLVGSSLKVLRPTGELHILLPVHESQLLRDLLRKHEVSPLKSIKVFNRPTDQKPFRIIQSFSRNPALKFQEERFVIRNEQNQYTQEFVDALSPFYLHL